MFNQLIELNPVLHAASTWFMVGLIWFVQVVHYPLMGVVRGSASVEYAEQHQRRTTWIVGPVMLVEAVTAVLLIWPMGGGFAESGLGWIGGGLLAVAWVSTFCVQVPLHQKLLSGFDAAVHRRLVRTNWVRTAVWSARGIVAILILLAA